MNKWPHAGPWTTLIYKTLSALEFGCCQSACCAAVVCRRFLFVVLPFLIYIAPRTAVAIQWRSQCENSIGLLSHLSLRLLFLPIAISLPLPPNPFPSFGSSILYWFLSVSSLLSSSSSETRNYFWIYIDDYYRRQTTKNRSAASIIPTMHHTVFSKFL